MGRNCEQPDQKVCTVLGFSAENHIHWVQYQLALLTTAQNMCDADEFLVALHNNLINKSMWAVVRINTNSIIGAGEISIPVIATLTQRNMGGLQYMADVNRTLLNKDSPKRVLTMFGWQHDTTTGEFRMTTTEKTARYGACVVARRDHRTVPTDILASDGLARADWTADDMLFSRLSALVLLTRLHSSVSFSFAPKQHRLITGKYKWPDV